MRAFGHLAEPPVVILGQFGNHEGMPLTNATEEGVGSTQAALYPDVQPVRFVLHPRTGRRAGSQRPGGLADSGDSAATKKVLRAA